MEIPKYKKCIISVSFGDYTKTSGGVAKVIKSHQEMFNNSGISYLAFFPLNLRNSVATQNNTLWGVILDGKFIDVATIDKLLTYFFLIQKKEIYILAIHVHHLKNVNLSDLNQIFEFIDTDIIFYIHDYYYICTSIKLLDENGNLCEGNYLNNDKCSRCKYYPDSVKVSSQFQNIIDTYLNRVIIICPSDAAKTWFVKMYPSYEKRIKVLYHQRMEENYLIPKKESDVIKIGYVGSPIISKGWNVFKTIYSRYQDNPNYDFVYFSSTIDPDTTIRNVSVDFQKGLNSMIDALRKEKVDYVFLYSIWPETYSYTFYESYCAGCCVITSNNSGNIQAQVIERKNGKILSLEDIISFFDNFAQVVEYRSEFLKKNVSVPLNLIENDDIVELSSLGDIPHNKLPQKCKIFELKSLAIKYLYKMKTRLINR